MTAALKWPEPERHEWTVDDLDELPRDLPYELINGRLIVPSPTVAHQDQCVEVLLALRINCPPDYVVSHDQSMKVNPRNEPRPDVVALRPEHIDRSPIPIEDLVLAVEVISPDSTVRDMYEKANLYAESGVPTYWVIDPLHERIMLTEMLLGANRRYQVGEETADVFITERPWPVTLDLSALTQRRKDLLGRAGAAI